MVNNNIKFLLSLIFSLLTLSGCSHHAQIIIDPNGVDMGRYQQDLAECQNLANQVHSKTGEKMLFGAVIGAIAGGIIGDSDFSNRTAKLGALSGGVEGAGETRQERIKVVKNCLHNRGYQVLN